MRALPFVAAVVLIAGCATPPATNPRSDAATLPDLSDLAAPEFDTGRARMWWEEFVLNHPARHAGSPTNVQAAEQLMADLEAAGYEARMLYYTPAEGRLPVDSQPSPVEAGFRAVVGIKKGSVEPEKVVAWVAHYDSNRQTVYAAYDDGSGTAVALELARTLATFDNRKTLMPIFFDGEEMGLVVSQAFVQQALASDEHTFDMVIGHDMTGINCPGHEWPMYQMVGENFADVLLPIERALYRDFLRYDVGEASVDTEAADLPRNCIVLLDGHDRNSDERHFKEADIPILRMAGGRKAVDYPAYHQPNDTVEYVYEFAGGAENYEKGLGMVLNASWWNVAVFDRLPSLG